MRQDIVNSPSEPIHRHLLRVSVIIGIIAVALIISASIFTVLYVWNGRGDIGTTTPNNVDKTTALESESAPNMFGVASDNPYDSSPTNPLDEVTDNPFDDVDYNPFN